MLKLAPNLGWGELQVVDEMRDRLGGRSYPLRVDNEANLAALAAYSEMRQKETPDQDGKPIQDLVLLTGAVGVGGGIVPDGHLLRGGHGFSGEVGHMPVAPRRRDLRLRPDRLLGDRRRTDRFVEQGN